MNDEFLKFNALKKQITRGPFATSLAIKALIKLAL